MIEKIQAIKSLYIPTCVISATPVRRKLVVCPNVQLFEPETITESFDYFSSDSARLRLLQKVSLHTNLRAVAERHDAWIAELFKTFSVEKARKYKFSYIQICLAVRNAKTIHFVVDLGLYRFSNSFSGLLRQFNLPLSKEQADFLINDTRKADKDPLRAPSFYKFTDRRRLREFNPIIQTPEKSKRTAPLYRPAAKILKLDFVTDTQDHFANEGER